MLRFLSIVLIWTITITILCTSNAMAQRIQVTQGWINFEFLADNDIPFDDLENGYIIMGELQIPANDQGLEEDELYSLVFAPGVDIVFSNVAGNGVGGSLTMQVSNEGAIGRIQVQGTEANPVLMEGAFATWNGIIINTDPGGWDGEDFTLGNYLGFCNMTELAATGITIGGASQAYIKGCYINPEDNDGISAIGEDAVYRIHSNEIENCNRPIVCQNPVDLGEGLEDIIANNYIHDYGEPIMVSGGWNGGIVNNILSDARAPGGQAGGIWCMASELTVIRNNTLANGNVNRIAIVVSTDWCTVENNIIVNWDFGISTDDEEAVDVAFCLFADIPEDQEFAGEAAGDETCLLDTDPDFVNAGADDFHLLHTSPAINAGNPAAAFDDPDGSDNDIGAFGGPAAGDFNLAGYEDYVLLDDGVWNDPVTLEWDTYLLEGALEVNDELNIEAHALLMIEADIQIDDEIDVDDDVKFQFANETGILFTAGSSGTVGVEDEDHVVFEGLDGAALLLDYNKE